MTIIKQKGVTEKGHAKNLRNYINDKKALLREFQNITHPIYWSDEMARTRSCHGHDKAARKGSRNTIMYHQVLAFLPDECDVNGGVLTPERCMEYAKEYAQKRYPDQQIAFALHKEHCKADKTDRYAVHMAINRTNLRTHKRLDEGRGEKAKRDRAEFVRTLDAEWNLQQVEEGVQNSKIHARQPDRVGAEKEIVDRAEKQKKSPEEASYKYNLRKLCQIAKGRVTSMEDYCALLAEWGVKTEIRDGKLFATDTNNDKYSFRVSRLDKALSENLLERAFASNSSSDTNMSQMEEEIKIASAAISDYNEKREKYLNTVNKCYANYKKEIAKQKGSRLEDIPSMRLPRIPEEMSKDNELRRRVLMTIRQGEDARKRAASNAPHGGATKTQKSQTISQQRQQVQRDEQKNKGER